MTEFQEKLSIANKLANTLLFATPFIVVLLWIFHMGYSHLPAWYGYASCFLVVGFAWRWSAGILTLSQFGMSIACVLAPVIAAFTSQLFMDGANPSAEDIKLAAAGVGLICLIATLGMSLMIVFARRLAPKPTATE